MRMERWRVAALVLTVVLVSRIPAVAADALRDSAEALIDPAIDRAVDKGLAYLGKAQKNDGSFSAEFGKSSGVVSLCGMAFLAKGHLPGRGQYGDVINRCIDYVLKEQTSTGIFDKDGHSGSQGMMYSHNISTLFLCEVSGMVDAERQKKIDAALPKAIKVTLSAQMVRKDRNNKGGWRYQPTSTDSDLSCSGWALMALKSARLNGAAVPKQAIDDAVAYILSKNNKQTGQFGYQDPNGCPVTLTGAALLCLELTGHHGEDCTYKAGSYILQTHKQLPSQGRAFYGNYYNAQGMFQLGGKYWEKYSQWMYGYWLPKQRADGAWAGDQYGNTYSTAMMTLAFAVPYRQLPIYQRDETVDDKAQ